MSDVIIHECPCGACECVEGNWWYKKPKPYGVYLCGVSVYCKIHIAFCPYCIAKLSFNEHGKPVVTILDNWIPSVNDSEINRRVTNAIQVDRERIQRELAIMQDDGCDIEDALNRASLWSPLEPDRTKTQ